MLIIKNYSKLRGKLEICIILLFFRWLVRRLKALAALVNADASAAVLKDEQGCTVLHWACYNGNSNCVEYLLEQNVIESLEGNSIPRIIFFYWFEQFRTGKTAFSSKITSKMAKLWMFFFSWRFFKHTSPLFTIIIMKMKWNILLVDNWSLVKFFRQSFLTSPLRRSSGLGALSRVVNKQIRRTSGCCTTWYTSRKTSASRCCCRGFRRVCSTHNKRSWSWTCWNRSSGLYGTYAVTTCRNHRPIERDWWDDTSIIISSINRFFLFIFSIRHRTNNLDWFPVDKSLLFPPPNAMRHLRPGIKLLLKIFFFNGTKYYYLI